MELQSKGILRKKKRYFTNITVKKMQLFNAVWTEPWVRCLSREVGLDGLSGAFQPEPSVWSSDYWFPRKYAGKLLYIYIDRPESAEKNQLSACPPLIHYDALWTSGINVNQFRTLKKMLLKQGHYNLIHPVNHVWIKAACACTDSGNYRGLFQKNTVFHTI